MKLLFNEIVGRQHDFIVVAQECIDADFSYIGDEARDILLNRRYDYFPLNNEVVDIILSNQENLKEIWFLCLGTDKPDKDTRKKFKSAGEVLCTYIDYTMKHTSANVISLTDIYCVLILYYKYRKLKTTYKFSGHEPSDYNKSLSAVAKGQSNNRERNEILWLELKKHFERIVLGSSIEESKLHLRIMQKLDEIIKWVFEACCYNEVVLRYSCATDFLINWLDTIE